MERVADGSVGGALDASAPRDVDRSLPASRLEDHGESRLDDLALDPEDLCLEGSPALVAYRRVDAAQHLGPAQTNPAQSDSVQRCHKWPSPYLQGLRRRLVAAADQLEVAERHRQTART